MFYMIKAGENKGTKTMYIYFSFKIDGAVRSCDECYKEVMIICLYLVRCLHGKLM